MNGNDMITDSMQHALHGGNNEIATNTPSDQVEISSAQINTFLRETGAIGLGNTAKLKSPTSRAQSEQLDNELINRFFRNH